MSITEVQNAFVNPGAVTIGLSRMFAVTPSAGNPAYVVLAALDRDEYTAGATHATGYFTGNGHTLSLANIGGDGRGAGIVFTYQAASGRYYSSVYGYFDQLGFTSSASLADVTNLSLFGTNNLTLATSYANNAVALMQVDAAGYLGSATVATQPRFTGAVPAQATPQSIAAVAQSFVGQAWNMEGCWVLASTIAAEAGASLPVQSTLIGLSGQGNGEWITAFNGPAGQTGDWQSQVRAGEIVVIGTPGGGGHITTCVSGSGASAMLVDNITYVNSNGTVQNSANDGSSADVIIAAPHAASQEWAGVQASLVVIYQLDTPIVTATVASSALACLASVSLGSLFTAYDPGGKPVALWQVYDTAATDSLVLGGSSYSAHSASSAVTAGSLVSVSLLAGSVATSDTVQVRAYNGTYWGDWAGLSVTVTSSAPVLAPQLIAQTVGQTWVAGRAFTLALPGSTFRDPQGQTLTYTARLSNGQALPSWLSFNAASRTFSGTAPATAQTLSLKVTATDTSGLAASETIGVSVQAPVPTPAPTPTPTPTGGITLAAQTPAQVWTAGQTGHLVLPSNTFSDALGLRMSFAAYQVSGPNTTSWLHFDPATLELYGTVPASASGTIGIAILASDSMSKMAVDSFVIGFASGHARSGGYPGAAQSPRDYVSGLLALHA